MLSMSDEKNSKPENKRPEPQKPVTTKPEPAKPEPKSSETKKPEPKKPETKRPEPKKPESKAPEVERPATYREEAAIPEKKRAATSQQEAKAQEKSEKKGVSAKDIFTDKRFFVVLFLVVMVGMGIFLFSDRDTGSSMVQPLPPIPTAEPVAVASPTPAASPEIPPEDVEYTDENVLNGIPIVGRRYLQNGMWQSYLTGEWKDVNVATRRPLAVMIANNQPALPQYGLSQYSVMYEAAVEGRVTRLMAIFEDYDEVQRIGPVRSARDYFVYEAMGKNAIFCNWGLAVVYTADLINSDKVDNISVKLTGINVGADKAFGRITRPGYAMEYTGYLKTEGYTEEVARLGYSQTYQEDFVPQFTFAAENTRVEYEDAPDIKIIRPGGTTANQGGYGNTTPYFEYNEEDQLYYRFQANQKQVYEMNNEQLYCSNVVFQYAHGEVRDGNDYLAFAVHGEGYKAVVFTNGKMIEGTWRRMDGDRKPAKFYDEDGKEIILNQGKTWICLIWEEHSDAIVLE
jgi:hypothetical protein